MMHRSVAPMGCAALMLALASCSYGTVVDKDTHEPLGGARISARAVTIRRTVRGGVLALSSASQSAVTWDASAGGAQAAGTWYLNPYGTSDASLRDALRIPEGLIRFLVARDGYDTRAFFRNHYYEACSVASGANSISGGAEPLVLDAPQQAGSCRRESFELSRNDQNYVKDPDVIVDPRMLLDYTFVSTRGTTPPPTAFEGITTCEGRADRCIRVTVATANVGVGDLWLTAPRGDQSNVTQHRHRRNSGTVDAPLHARFVSDTHPHLHLEGWTLLRLRKIEPRCETQLTASECPVAQVGTKISFCLRDSANVDSNANSAAGVYRPNRTYDCGADDTIISQGISAGRMDIYARDLVGQMIPVDGLHGAYWLEAEVNPVGADGQRIALESDYENNVSRIRISIP